MNYLDKVLARCVSEGECLVWTGALNSDGYPRAGIKGNSNINCTDLYVLITTILRGSWLGIHVTILNV